MISSQLVLLLAILASSSTMIKSTHIRDIRRIRHRLSLSTATALAISFVSGKLDYCNSLYSGISQTHSTFIVTCHYKHFEISTDHTNTQKKLHWLPIKQRIDYKICFLTYITLTNQQPSYLHNSLSFPSHSVSTRSVYPHFDSCYYHVMPCLITPGVRHRAIYTASFQGQEINFWYHYKIIWWIVVQPALQYRRWQRPSLLHLLSEFGLIPDGWLDSISSLRDWPMQLSAEGYHLRDWSLQLYPGVNHSKSRHHWHGTVVKPHH